MGIDVEREMGREWLETDGLGGYAIGNVAGIRTRRYHGLLMVARRPPAERTLLVAGLEAWIERGGERIAISSQRYAPGVTHPDGASRIARFDASPWPRWTYALPDACTIEHEVFMPHARPAVALAWTSSMRSRLCVRLLLAARDFHSMQHESAALHAHPSIVRGRLCFRLYEGAPELAIASDADYAHDPMWYRSFLYERERERGLDATEDLFSPGTMSWELAEGGRAALVLSARELDRELAEDPKSAAELHDVLAARERTRREAFVGGLDRAAEQYVVRRGAGKTIIAGYPWFGDWGRDTFLSLRGLCTAADARAILREWARFVDRGTLPNRFPDHGEEPEHNSVDAALWYVIAAGELGEGDAEIERAIDAIVAGYRQGTRYGIRADHDGLLAAGEAGQQLTWMDARVEGREVTPRIGKPVEINALWLNVLAIAARRDRSLEPLIALGKRSFHEKFVIAERGYLADVIDVDHVPGAIDRRLRPNQILALGGLPIAIVEGPLARSIVDAVERELWTPLGLRTLGRGEPGYAGQYEGGPRERDAAYHQGTAWPWLIGPFIDAWLRVRDRNDEAKREARERFIAPLIAHLDEHGLGHVCEIADAEAPHTPRGCPFQAWSLAELRRAIAMTETLG